MGLLPPAQRRLVRSQRHPCSKRHAPGAGPLTPPPPYTPVVAGLPADGCSSAECPSIRPAQESDQAPASGVNRCNILVNVVQPLLHVRLQRTQTFGNPLRHVAIA